MSPNKKFAAARTETLKHSLLSTTELFTLRSQIEKENRTTKYCDSCGFCCLEGIEMLKLEADRILKRRETQPDMLQPQGYLCPFLAINLADLNHNVKTYAHSRTPMRASFCRIYDERPMICRLFPAPDELQCRRYNMVESPNPIPTLLSHKISPDFPESLLEKYYLTLKWEWLNLPLTTQWNLAYQLIPGWACQPDTRSIQKHEGPQWLTKFEVLPDFFSLPTAYHLSAEEFKVISAFQTPTTYQNLLDSLAKTVPAADLGAIVGYLEFANLIIPLDIGLRMVQGKKMVERANIYRSVLPEK